MPLPHHYRSKRKRSSLWIHLLLFFSMVGFPALVTALLPVSVTRFTRADGAVTAVVQKKLLFIIPYYIARIEGVTEVNERTTAGELVQTTSDEDRRQGRHFIRTEDTGVLVIRGGSGQVEVEVSPHDLTDVFEEARSFLANPAQPELRLFTVANWKGSVFAGGPLTALTLLYVFGLLSSIWARLTGKSERQTMRSKASASGSGRQ
jgi:hypothetical protein